jgi:endo-1,4-beta-xylanase
MVSVGGMNGSGGATATGGTMIGSGGNPATGGTTGSGGSLATGGNSSTGGATATGGVTGNGGSTGTATFPPKFFGNIDSANEIRSDFATYWDQFVPENVGKWSWVQGSSASTFDWARVDAVYKYCEDNHILFKEHSFVWGSNQAAWINSTNAVAAVQNWMKAFCVRYSKTRLIDVVDEPLHTSPSYASAIGGGGGTTWDWVANSFKWAHEACPNAILILNDYNIIEYSDDHNRIIAMAKTILAAGAPVMAIGAQGNNAYKFSGSTLQTAIADIASQTGLPVYITQMEFPVADDDQQAAIMKDLVTTFWNDTNVLGITYWGYIVGNTWRSNTGLMTSDGTMRPAMIWLMDFLGR